MQAVAKLLPLVVTIIAYADRFAVASCILFQPLAETLGQVFRKFFLERKLRGTGCLLKGYWFTLQDAS